MENFRKLGISEEILKAIVEEKFEKPSEIQEKAIPPIISGKDVIIGSATGSGKTLVFGSGIIQNTETGKGIQALILAPTRELAEQNTKSLKKFSKYKHLNFVPVYGGVSINPQIEELKRADVVIGTPGRILDHINRRTLDFEKLKILVLDEADRMFDMGFIDDIRKIINQCPIRRQTIVCSATISEDIVRLAQRYMKEPIEVSAEAHVDPTKLTQIYYDVPSKEKFSMLVHLLQHEKSNLVMVFCNTRRNTDFVAKNLKFSGINAMAIHGGFSQEKRNNTMEGFHSKRISVLVCTDLAARGLDIKGVSHIYNYDIPNDSKEYVHRVGRTARAGKEGKAINLLSDRDYENFTKILKDTHINVVEEKMPQIDRATIKWHPEEKRSRRFGGSNFRRKFRR